MKVRLWDVFERQITGEWGNECSENEPGAKVLRTTNFTSSGEIDFKNVVMRSINKSKVQSKRLHYGDIILEKSGGTEKTPVGRVVFCDESIENDIYLCNNFTQTMRVNQVVGYPRYVFYFMWYLHYSGKTDLLQNKTTGIRNLQLKSYLNEEIPLPPLDEQRRIAAVLDKVSDLIAKRRAQLDKLDELVKARFVEMFGSPVSNTLGWNQTKLSEVTSKIGSGATPKGGKESYHSEGVSLIRSMNIHDGLFLYKDLAHITDEQARQLDNVAVEDQDVFINITGASVARSCIVPHEVLPARVNQHVAIIRCIQSQMNPIFASNMFINDEFKKQLLEIGESGGATRQAITKQQLQDLNIILPPLELQNKFATSVNETNQSKLTIQQSLDRLEILKKALMQEYFG